MIMKDKYFLDEKEVFTECTFVGDGVAVFRTEVRSTEYDNLLGVINTIVRKKSDVYCCNSDYRKYNGFNRVYLEMAESQCVKRAKFIFTK